MARCSPLNKAKFTILTIVNFKILAIFTLLRAADLPLGGRIPFKIYKRTFPTLSFYILPKPKRVLRSSTTTEYASCYNCENVKHIKAS